MSNGIEKGDLTFSDYVEPSFHTCTSLDQCIILLGLRKELFGK